MNILRTSDANQFRFGYRYVARKDERGREQFIMVPLTDEDILHPQLEDHVTQNIPHNRDYFYLFGTFQIQMADRKGALVLGDHQIKWDLAGMGDHGPDVAVVLGLQHPPHSVSSFNVAREGARPELIVEVTSPSTRHNDLNVKPREYWLCQVPYYVIVDELPRRRQRQLRILGFRRGPRRYRRMPLDAV